MEKGLRENTKEENMEDDGGVKMRRRRYETETRGKVQAGDNQGEMRWVIVRADNHEGGVRRYSE